MIEIIKTEAIPTMGDKGFYTTSNVSSNSSIWKFRCVNSYIFKDLYMDVRLFPTGILLQTLQTFGLVFQNEILVMHNFTFSLYFISTVPLKGVFRSFIVFVKASTVDILVVFITKNRFIDIFRIIKKTAT